MSLTSITGVRSNLGISGSADKTVSGLVGTVTGTITNVSALGTSWSLGTGAAAINEIIQVVRTLAASGTETIDLTATLTNICNSTGIALTSIKEILIELLSVADDA